MQYSYTTSEVSFVHRAVAEEEHSLSVSPVALHLPLIDIAAASTLVHTYSRGRRSGDCISTCIILESARNELLLSSP